jgi:hypothetical protein
VACRVGEAIMKREVWRGKPWEGVIVLVEDDASALPVGYLPEGSPFGFPAGDWPEVTEIAERWWDETWSRREPPVDWLLPPLPKGWDVV